MAEGFLLRPKARSDLLAIADYGKGRWSPERVDRYLAEIQNAVAMLAQFPKMGVDQPLLIGDVRTFFVGTHVIVYAGADPIEILGFPHQSSDWYELFDGLSEG